MTPRKWTTTNSCVSWSAKYSNYRPKPTRNQKWLALDLTRDRNYSHHEIFHLTPISYSFPFIYQGDTVQVMTSWHDHAISFTGPLWGESTSQRDSNVQLWCFLHCSHELTVTNNWSSAGDFRTLILYYSNGRINISDHSGHGISQWETTLQISVSHSLSPYPGWSLKMHMVHSFWWLFDSRFSYHLYHFNIEL